MDNATQNGEQPSREDKNLWLSLLKEAHESTQDTFHKDGACWIIGPPGAGKRSLVDSLRQYCVQVNKPPQKESQDSHRKDKSEEKEKGKSQTEARSPPSPQHHHQSSHSPAAPFVPELASPYYTYFQSDGSRDDESPGKVHFWVLDAVHLLHDIKSTAKFRNPYEKSGDNSADGYCLPIIFVLDASKPWELSSQFQNWSKTVSHFLKELEHMASYHLIVCLSKIDVLVDDEQTQSPSKTFWSPPLPESKRLSSRELDIVQKEFREFCLQSMWRSTSNATILSSFGFTPGGFLADNGSLIYHSSKAKSTTGLLWDTIATLHEGKRLKEMEEKANILHKDAMQGTLFIPHGVDSTNLIKDIGIEDETMAQLPTPPDVIIRSLSSLGIATSLQGKQKKNIDVEQLKKENDTIVNSTKTTQQWLKELSEEFSVAKPKETYSSFLEDVFHHVKAIATEEANEETTTEASAAATPAVSKQKADEDDEVTFNIKPKPRAVRTSDSVQSSDTQQAKQAQATPGAATSEGKSSGTGQNRPSKKPGKSQKPQQFFQKLREGKSSQKK